MKKRNLQAKANRKKEMKIRCDACEGDEASLYCVADEAALCAACDHRVHRANKLAGKHQRFSLHHPSPKQAHLCDICQERKAFLFCLEDRAILCRECDIPIHKANGQTQKHTRFLFTGVKLSSLQNEVVPVSESTTLRSGAAPESCQKSDHDGSIFISEEYLIDVDDFLH